MQVLAAAGVRFAARLHFRQQLRKDVARGDAEGELAIEVGMGIGRFLRDELEDAFVDGGDRDRCSRFCRHFDRQRVIRSEIGRCDDLRRDAIGGAIDIDRNRTKRAARFARLEISGGANDRRGDVRIRSKLGGEWNRDLAAVAGERFDRRVVNVVAFERDEKLAGERRLDLQRRRIAGRIFIFVELQLEASRILHRPRRVTPSTAIEVDFGRRAGRWIADDDAKCAIAAGDERDAPARRAGRNRLRLEQRRLPRRLVSIAAARCSAQHGVPFVLVQLGAKCATLHRLAIDADRNPFERHFRIRLGVCVRVAAAPKSDVVRPGVHRNVCNGSDAASALLLHA